jgi:hypothetical protein
MLRFTGHPTVEIGVGTVKQEFWGEIFSQVTHAKEGGRYAISGGAMPRIGSDKETRLRRTTTVGRMSLCRNHPIA